MKLTIRMEDKLYDALEKKAGGKRVEELISENIDFLMKVNKMDNQILLNGSDVTKIATALGGQIVKTADDVTSAFVNRHGLLVNGINVQLDPEDIKGLEDRFESTGYKDYGKYVEDSIKEALCAYLWGSTRGVLAW